MNEFVFKFQSHAGSIEAPGRFGPGRFGCGFNPTLVRLRRDDLVTESLCKSEFQSHAGSIEAGDLRLLGGVPAEFQSHAGSIEAQPYSWKRAKACSVSIPRWFD